MRSLVYLIFLCPLLVACSDPKQALDTWVHADAGSYGAAISPNGKLLLTGDIDGFARIWDLQNN
jgi:WD40 repeat protein